MADPVENLVTGRTQMPVCRCSVPKDADTYPGLLLCPMCDMPVLQLVTVKDL